MNFHLRTATLVLSAICLQSAHLAAASTTLPPKTTLPIVFTDSVDANHVHAGDVVHARTIQAVVLPGGETLRSGALITGHVVAARPFVFDKTPYAKQQQSKLSVHFDRIDSGSLTLPLDVYVRAIADPITSWDAHKPMPNADNSYITFMQVGGDVVNPHQSEVVSEYGDVIGYNRDDGVYAHLISAVGDSPAECDGSDFEEPMGPFSASACGLYGFSGTALQNTGRTTEPSVLALVSSHRAPKIWKNSTALLEVRPANSTVASR